MGQGNLATDETSLRSVFNRKRELKSRRKEKEQQFREAQAHNPKVKKKVDFDDEKVERKESGKQLPFSNR